MEKIAHNKNISNIKSIFEDEINKIQKGIDNYGEGQRDHIAVISEPFSGIDHIFDIISGDNSQKAGDIKLFSPVRDTEYFTNFYTHKNIILLRNCHYLYTRSYGGFSVLEAFLDIISSTEKLFVTGWNRFTWDYLKEVSDIEYLFPVRIEVPKLDSKSLKNVIMSNVDEKITFIDDRDFSEAEKFWAPVNYKINMPFREKDEIRLFKPNFRALKREKKTMTMEGLQNAVFLKITELADGKYELAEKIWKKSLKDNEIMLSRIPGPPSAGIPDLNESFVLSIILSMESITYDDLLKITGSDISLRHILYRLINPGLIEETNNLYSINPEAVNFIINNLKKSRVVW